MGFIAGLHVPDGWPVDPDTLHGVLVALDEKTDTVTSEVTGLAAQMAEVRILLGLQPPAYDETTPARDDNLVFSVVEQLAAVDLRGVWIEETERYGAQVVHHLSDGGTITITVDHTPGDRPLDDEGDGA